MSLLSIFLTFLRFGFNAWGGPVAQIDMLREELVMEKNWISKEKFKRVLAIYQALPGPEAHELCVYFGMIKGGRVGAILAGLGFMLPGLTLMLLLSWLYVSIGNSFLVYGAGIIPAVTALIVRASHRIAVHTLHNSSLVITALIAIALTSFGTHFLWVFLICALWHVSWLKGRYKSAILLVVTAMSIFFLSEGKLFETSLNQGGRNDLFVEGLKAGLLSFGGAYTTIPFLQESLVGHYPRITEQGFYDGLAIASMIPAPLVIFGTFLGFVAKGLDGALWMTAGIFLPAFSFTLIGHKWLEKLVNNSALHGILDSVAAAVVGILALTALNIFIKKIWFGDVLTMAIFGFALASLYLVKKKWITPLVMLISLAVGAMVLLLPQ